ncbi:MULTISPECIES: hypothetical protein [Actibacterium]|uniref:Uncharacterized protein n=1 Tax=Actibacterium naphthalenivorans TaxID=1614693 RepID=A0A840CGY4_9RHOB|nr:MULTISPECIES: hypothetical protein [Actibacterium]MBB4022529.1 hypothetical protein [Actibacterium naphthalenivorans]
MQDTVGSYVASLLLQQSQSSTTQDSLSIWYPTDLFLVTASLLDAAGAYAHFDPDPDSDAIRDGFPRFTLSPTIREGLCRLGKKWNSEGKTTIPSEISKKWAAFLEAYRNHPMRPTTKFISPPTWWSACYELFVIADEACEGLGSPNEGQPSLWKTAVHHQKILSRKQSSSQLDDEGFDVSAGSSPTFSVNCNGGFANVFPKTRVSTAGCSHRNFSRNVALLPKTGNVRCHWHLPSEPLADDKEKPIDILIIPYPFEIPALAFRSAQDPKESMHRGDDSKRGGWANFKIIQTWLTEPEKLIDLVAGLARSAKKDVDSLNGVVFPEYSLSFDIFLKLCEELKRVEPCLEFVVAGSSNNCDSRGESNGNHVLTCVWHKLESDSDEELVEASSSDSEASQSKPKRREADRRAILSSRKKHHRWMLTPSQLSDYAITSSLDPRVNWWETHNIGQREMHFFPFRKNSTFTSMICEDLARSDPCHEVLRSIGPNLVFVLLMDGPQLVNRWSARYACSLSDDPGCSVLTLTSFGLIERSNRTQAHKPQRAIAFFSSPFGQTSLYLPNDNAKALLITLTGEEESHRSTIDGRIDNNSRAWRLTSTQPVYEICGT